MMQDQERGDQRMLIVMQMTLMDRGMAAWRGALLAMIILSALPAGNRASAATLREEQQCLALSLYWEARGEGRRGMVAVGWTILNRVNSPDFPRTPCAVVHQGGEIPPCQFSWWCDGRSDRPRDQHSWNLALAIAGELLVNPPPDPTGGSLYYHSTKVRPPWRHRRAPTTQIGAHVFYR